MTFTYCLSTFSNTHSNRLLFIYPHLNVMSSLIFITIIFLKIQYILIFYQPTNTNQNSIAFLSTIPTKLKFSHQ